MLLFTTALAANDKPEKLFICISLEFVFDLRMFTLCVFVPATELFSLTLQYAINLSLASVDGAGAVGSSFLSDAHEVKVLLTE